MEGRIEVFNTIKKESGSYDLFYEIELDNGCYIFFNENLMTWEYPDNQEDLDAILEGDLRFYVMKESIIDKINTEAEDELWENFPDYESTDVNLKDWGTYMMYMDLINIVC